MKQIQIADNENVLFDTTLEPSMSHISNTKGVKPVEDNLVELQGKENRLKIGLPLTKKIRKQDYDKEELKIDFDKKNVNFQKYDYYLIALSCSTLPDPSCKFVWVQLSIKLISYDEDNSCSENRPLALSLYPTELVTSVEHDETISVTPELEFKAGAVGSVKLFEITSNKKYSEKEPQLFSFGVRTSDIAWQLRSTHEKEIYGDIRDLMFIVQIEKGKLLKAKINVSAEVETNSKIFKLSKRDNFDHEYNLSEM